VSDSLGSAESGEPRVGRQGSVSLGWKGGLQNRLTPGRQAAGSDRKASFSQMRRQTPTRRRQFRFYSGCRDTCGPPVLPHGSAEGRPIANPRKRDFGGFGSAEGSFSRSRRLFVDTSNGLDAGYIGSLQEAAASQHPQAVEEVPLHYASRLDRCLSPIRAQYQ